jgi:uncharacterized protein YkwD
MSRGWLLAVPTGLALALLTAWPAAGDDKKDAKVDRDEARKAFDYLNKVRKDPSKFSKEIGVDLSAVKPRDELKWNDILAKVAEAKALDMANRDYVDHVTPDGLGINVMIDEAGYKLPAAWVKDKKANFFESIGAGQDTGVEVIQFLIIDKDVKEAMHRQHLLGMSDFYSGCTDAGIGFARNPKSNLRTYISIILARKK